MLREQAQPQPSLVPSIVHGVLVNRFGGEQLAPNANDPGELIASGMRLA
jgi:hypothetical protein